MEIFKITKSKTKEALLRLYFSDPEQRYYLRQLEKILDLPVGNIRRELLFLEKNSIFNREAKDSHVYYSLNKKSAIFPELKKIIFKTIGVEGLLKDVLGKISDIEAAFIFGSLAKGGEDSYSDIDLMIIGDPQEDKLAEEIMAVEGKINREINYHIFSSDDWRKKTRTRNDFLLSIVKNPKIILIDKKNVLSRFNKTRIFQKRRNKF